MIDAIENFSEVHEEEKKMPMIMANVYSSQIEMRSGITRILTEKICECKCICIFIALGESRFWRKITIEEANRIFNAP